MYCSLPGSSADGIFQARVLEWVAISFSNAWKWKVKSDSEVAQSCPTLCDHADCSLPGFSIHGIFPGKSTGVDCHFLLQGIFPTQGLNLSLPVCRQMLYHLSHQGSQVKDHIANKKSSGIPWKKDKKTHSLSPIPLFPFSLEDPFNPFILTAPLKTHYQVQSWSPCC